MRDLLKIFAGNSNRPLAQEICAYLGVQLGAADVKTFSDGEIAVEITENVRGGDVFGKKRSDWQRPDRPQCVAKLESEFQAQSGRPGLPRGGLCHGRRGKSAGF